ncbi:STAS domain-containing protein [Citricoccus sp. NPDC079358]|jgi:anti-sigma B factor antagonist|uniref:STAS domain-containing protein n=1 Tax=Citricoccus sp. NPDC079358 TaxID=3154653 RepID=UPI00344E8975
MQVTVERHDTYTEVRGEGRLNMAAAPKLKDVISSEISAGSRQIVVDLSATEFMDSSGLGALIGCLKMARQAGGDLRISQVPPQVLMVLQLTSMDRVLTPYPDSASAFSRA